MISDNKTLDKVYTATNHEELMDAYKDWAGEYDHDTVGRFGYMAHIAVAKALERVMEPGEGRILDAGCGTGLVGEVLEKMGYADIDALDYSKAMLEEAERKGVFRDFIHADMSKPLDIEDDAYKAIVCAGTFTYGHVKADAFDELIRVTVPGGVICFTIREGAYEDYGYREHMIDLERKGAWELLAMYDEDYLREEGVTCKVCTYRVKNGNDGH